MNMVFIQNGFCKRFEISKTSSFELCYTLVVVGVVVSDITFYMHNCI